MESLPLQSVPQVPSNHSCVHSNDLLCAGMKRVRPVDVCNDEDNISNGRSAKKKLKTIRKK